jgi:hypothetical protein
VAFQAPVTVGVCGQVVVAAAWSARSSSRSAISRLEWYRFSVSRWSGLAAAALLFELTLNWLLAFCSGTIASAAARLHDARIDQVHPAR